jgi:hypothetical protein
MGKKSTMGRPPVNNASRCARRRSIAPVPLGAIMRASWLLVAILAAASARADGEPAPVAASSASAPPSASAKVHDHVAFTFEAADGNRSPQARAAEATQNLNAVIDEEMVGPVVVILPPGTEAAEVRLGNRVLFRLVPADASADGAATLAEYAPRVQGRLEDFLTRERRRAHLQRGVLSGSLAVFFALLAWVLLRAFYRATRSFEEKLEQGESALPAPMRSLGLATERSRGLVLFGLNAVRLAATLGAIYLFLLATLSLFESARPYRDRLALWAAAPFRALADRLIHGLPNLILLLVVLAVLRAGWRAMTVGFERVVERGEGHLAQHQVIPFRLLARVALVVGAVLFLPLVLGSDAGLFSALGLLMLAALSLAAVPLLATVVVGTFVLLTNQYPMGEWLSIRLPSGKRLSGEVVSVDFLHLRLVPELGGEQRVPHLLALWSAVEHLPSTRTLTLEFPVALTARAPRETLNLIIETVGRAAREQGVEGVPSVELREVTEHRALFRVAIAEAPETARTQILLALEEATRRGAP